MNAQILQPWPRTADVTRPVVPRVQLLLARKQMFTWWSTWLGIFSALSVLLGAVYLGATESGLRAAMLVGVVSSVLGVAGLMISPLRPAALKPRPRVTQDPPSQVRLFAAWEAQGKSWGNRLLAVAVAFGSAAVLLFYYELPIPAVGQLLMSMVLGQLQIFTQPTVAMTRRIS